MVSTSLLIVLLIIVLVIGFLIGHYNSGSNLSAGLTAPPYTSFADMNANPTSYLGKQITVNGTLSQYIYDTGAFNWSMIDFQGYRLNLTLPHDRIFYMENYSLTGIFSQAFACSCPYRVGISLVSNLTACTNKSSFDNTCKASTVYYLNVTTATRLS
jgi:hypothetical protein